MMNLMSVFCAACAVCAVINFTILCYVYYSSVQKSKEIARLNGVLMRQCEETDFHTKRFDEQAGAMVEINRKKTILECEVSNLKFENRIYKTFLNRLNINVELKDLKEE